VRAFRRGATREDAAALVEAFAAAPAGAWSGPVARGELVALVRGDCSRLESVATTKRAAAPAPHN